MSTELFKYLSERLSYDPITGELCWENTNNQHNGKRAGSYHKLTGYRRICINGSIHLEHRIAWLLHYGVYPKNQIDHINGVKDDNRIENLRDVGSVENARNRKVSSRNSTGIPGVRFYKRDANFRAEIGVGGEKEWLGAYLDFFEACCARKSAENRIGYHTNHGRLQ